MQDQLRYDKAKISVWSDAKQHQGQIAKPPWLVCGVCGSMMTCWAPPLSAPRVNLPPCPLRTSCQALLVHVSPSFPHVSSAFLYKHLILLPEDASSAQCQPASLKMLDTSIIVQSPRNLRLRLVNKKPTNNCTKLSKSSFTFPYNIPRPSTLCHLPHTCHRGW